MIFGKKDTYESHKIMENSNQIHDKISNPANWSSLDQFLTILSASKRKCDSAFASKQFSKALNHYMDRLNSGSLNFDENKSFTFMKIGHLLRLLNDDDKAIVSYRNALDINPDLDCAISSFSVIIDRVRSNSQL